MTDQEQLAMWRSWAQFVWKDGGPVRGTDDELRLEIARQFDTLNGEVKLLSELIGAVVGSSTRKDRP